MTEETRNELFVGKIILDNAGYPEYPIMKHRFRNPRRLTILEDYFVLVNGWEIFTIL